MKLYDLGHVPWIQSQLIYHAMPRLGLTFCKLAVEAHGGNIWLESETEQGSRFVFTIPTEEDECD